MTTEELQLILRLNRTVGLLAKAVLALAIGWALASIALTIHLFEHLGSHAR